MPWVGSPLPSPWAMEPHSIPAFQIAITAPWAPGNMGSATLLLLAVESVKLLKVRKSRWLWFRLPPIVDQASACWVGRIRMAPRPRPSAGTMMLVIFMGCLLYLPCLFAASMLVIFSSSEEIAMLFATA